jgi:hypothetical protein
MQINMCVVHSVGYLLYIANTIKIVMVETVFVNRHLVFGLWLGLWC